MPLKGIYGDVGSGKNIWEIIDLVNLPKEIPIYSNYGISLKQAELIEPEEVFEIFTEDRKQPIKKLVTDEATTWFEARGSGSTDLNKFLSYLIMQSRKRGLNWDCIAQLRATLDLRWRGLEDKLVYCHERELDMAGNSTDDFKFTLVKGCKARNVTLAYEKSKPFWGLYNTKEVIMPPDFKATQLKMKNKNPENLDKYITYLAKLIIKTFPTPKKFLKDGTEKVCITQEWVRDKILKCKKELEYSALVKGRISELLNID